MKEPLRTEIRNRLEAVSHPQPQRTRRNIFSNCVESVCLNELISPNYRIGIRHVEQIRLHRESSNLFQLDGFFKLQIQRKDVIETAITKGFNKNQFGGGSVEGY